MNYCLIFIYIYIYIYIYMCVCVCVCVWNSNSYIFVYRYICMYIHVFMYDPRAHTLYIYERWVEKKNVWSYPKFLKFLSLKRIPQRNGNKPKPPNFLKIYLKLRRNILVESWILNNFYLSLSGVFFQSFLRLKNTFHKKKKKKKIHNNRIKSR